jgi:NAD(P)-dependent dehydrogenase (short-subunit alcohol dehydrogenase family)
MKLLEGKVAIVTGAARGIGEAVAIKFAEHGAHVAFTFVSDSSKEKASALEAKLQGMDVKAKAYQSNAGEFAACETFVNDASAFSFHHGPDHLLGHIKNGVEVYTYHIFPLIRAHT